MIGIIGGTGLGEAFAALSKGEVHGVDTPFGKPSASIVTAEVGARPVALLARHGEGHLLNPSRVPYRANVFALKSLNAHPRQRRGGESARGAQAARAGRPRSGDRPHLPAR